MDIEVAVVADYPSCHSFVVVAAVAFVDSVDMAVAVLVVDFGHPKTPSF